MVNARFAVFGGDGVKDGWLLASGAGSKLIDSGVQAICEGEDANDLHIVPDGGATGGQALNFRTSINGLDVTRKWANPRTTGISGHEDRINIYAQTVKAVSWGNITAGKAIHFISHDNGRGTYNQPVWTVEDDGLMRIYAHDGTLLLTSDTALANNAFQRVGFLIDGWDGEHGGNWIIWLVQEISGVLTQVGVAEIAPNSWGVPAAGAEPAWVWGEKLAAGTNKGSAWTAFGESHIGVVSLLPHADTAPHIKSDLPVVDVLAQDHNTDGYTVDWNLTGDSAPNRHSKVQQVNNADTSYAEDAGSAASKEFVKSISLGLAAGASIVPGPCIRFVAKTPSGSKGSRQAVIHIASSTPTDKESGIVPTLASSYKHHTNGQLIRHPDQTPVDLGKRYSGTEVNASESGLVIATAGIVVRSTALFTYWAVEVETWPQLTLPGAAAGGHPRHYPVGVKRGVMTGVR